MVTIKVEARFSDSNNLFYCFDHAVEFIHDAVVNFTSVMRVNADAGIYVGITQGQIDAGTRTLQVTANGQNVLNTILASTFDNCIQIFGERFGVEVGVGINEWGS